VGAGMTSFNIQVKCHSETLVRVEESPATFLARKDTRDPSIPRDDKKSKISQTMSAVLNGFYVYTMNSFMVFGSTP
jgi:hypothetical protein